MNAPVVDPAKYPDNTEGWTPETIKLVIGMLAEIIKENNYKGYTEDSFWAPHVPGQDIMKDQYPLNL